MMVNDAARGSGLIENRITDRPEDRRLSTKQVAERLGVTPGTVRNWVLKGVLKPCGRLLNRDLRFWQSDADALIRPIEDDTVICGQRRHPKE